MKIDSPRPSCTNWHSTAPRSVQVESPGGTASQSAAANTSSQSSPLTGVTVILVTSSPPAWDAAVVLETGGVMSVPRVIPE